VLVTKQVSLGRAGIRCLSKRPLARSCNRGNAGRTSTIRVQVGHEAEQIVGEPEMLEHPISLSEPSPAPDVYTASSSLCPSLPTLRGCEPSLRELPMRKSHGRHERESWPATVREAGSRRCGRCAGWRSIKSISRLDARSRSMTSGGAFRARTSRLGDQFHRRRVSPCPVILGRSQRRVVECDLIQPSFELCARNWCWILERVEERTMRARTSGGRAEIGGAKGVTVASRTRKLGACEPSF